MAKEYFALDLFGGKEVVLEKMTSRVREDLIKKVFCKDENYRRGWFEGCGFDGPVREKIFGITRGQKVNYDTLNMLGQALDIDVNSILTNPKFPNKEIREYWLRQLNEKPMLISGGVPSENTSKEKELRFYIKIRLEFPFLIGL